jgi:hypothetical protein
METSTAVSEYITLYWSVGSLAVVSVFTLWLLNKYATIFPQKKPRVLDARKSHLSMVTIAITYISWVFGFATIAVLPVDIAISNSETNIKSQTLLHGFWIVFYWSSMLLSYIMIPWLMSYEMSGEFQKSERIKRSFIEMMQFYLYFAVAGVLFLLFLWIRGSISIKETAGGFTLNGFLMALGGAAGLLQIIVFLGYGLISVPRYVQTRANNKSRFDVALCAVDQCEDKMQQARLTAEDVLANALGMRNLNIVEVELQARLIELIDKFPKDMQSQTSAYTNYDHIDLAFSKGDYASLVYLN